MFRSSVAGFYCHHIAVRDLCSLPQPSPHLLLQGENARSEWTNFLINLVIRYVNILMHLDQIICF